MIDDDDIIIILIIIYNGCFKITKTLRSFISSARRDATPSLACLPLMSLVMLLHAERKMHTLICIPSYPTSNPLNAMTTTRQVS